MLDVFQAYPELVCINATYKLLELGLPAYLMLRVNSNGQSEVFFACSLVVENSRGAVTVDSQGWKE